MAMSEIQEFLAEFCVGQAEHRDRKAEAYPEDARNATSAKILREFADWVRGLPSARVDLAQLEALTAPWERRVHGVRW